MEAATTFSRRAMPRARGGEPTHPTFIRWLWVWITVLALVVVVVVGFLLGIVGALKSIDTGLAEANASVTGIGGEANPLPVYIQRINTNLTSINGALKPITGQAGQILGALTSIRGTLGQVQGSLVNTSGSLVNTSSSLIDTSNSLVNTTGTLGTISTSLVGTSGTLSGVAGSLVDTSNKLVTISGSLSDIANRLVTVRGQTGNINTTLNNAETVPTNGTQAIWRHVRFANGGSFSRRGFDSSLRGPGTNPNGLSPVQVDASKILAGLGLVNLHLNSICRAPVIHGAGSKTTVGLIVATLKAAGLINPGPCP